MGDAWMGFANVKWVGLVDYAPFDIAQTTAPTTVCATMARAGVESESTKRSLPSFSLPTHVSNDINSRIVTRSCAGSAGRGSIDVASITSQMELCLMILDQSFQGGCFCFLQLRFVCEVEH